MTDFTRKNLSGARFEDVNLTGADFHGVDLTGARFRLVDLTRVTIRGADLRRMAAQVVSSIGFLGAGLIFVRRDAVRGLTTAAAIWVTAAVGSAAGPACWYWPR